MFLGKYLYDQLMAYSKDDIVTLIIPPAQESSIFAQPKVKQFYVAGIIELGYYEYDRIFSYISLEEAQEFFGMPDAVSWIEIKIDDYEKASEVAQDLTEQPKNKLPRADKGYHDLNYKHTDIENSFWTLSPAKIMVQYVNNYPRILVFANTFFDL